MAYAILRGKRILLVEDLPDDLRQIEANLKRVGSFVTAASSVKEALRAIDKSCAKPFHVAIVDLYIPEETKDKTGRIMRGQYLAEEIRGRSPNTLIIGISAFMDSAPLSDTGDLFAAFLSKRDMPIGRPTIALLETLESLLLGGRRKPRVFIIHGHDGKILDQLKQYIQDTLDLEEPVVLRDRPSLGKTIIEKFEDEVKNVDLVFVLLTADDRSYSSSHKLVRRGRQNVIFELGFFYGKLQRRSGKILLLTKGDPEIPSDISGIVHIDVSKGIPAASKEINRELKALGLVRKRL